MRHSYVFPHGAPVHLTLDRCAHFALLERCVSCREGPLAVLSEGCKPCPRQGVVATVQCSWSQRLGHCHYLVGQPRPALVVVQCVVVSCAALSASIPATPTVAMVSMLHSIFVDVDRRGLQPIPLCHWTAVIE